MRLITDVIGGTIGRFHRVDGAPAEEGFVCHYLAARLINTSMLR
jgi:hypothetical protein